MKKILGYAGLVILVIFLGGLGAFLFDYVFFSKIVSDPIWSQHPFVQSLDTRMRIIKNTEKIIVENSESIADIAQRASTSVVYIEAIDANDAMKMGNGTIISSDGVIATTSEVVPIGYDTQYVKLADKTIHKAQKIYRDAYTGVVFLKIDAQNLATISFANSDEAQSGKRLISISQSRVDNGVHFSAGGLMGETRDFSVAMPHSDHLQGVFDIDFTESVLYDSVGAPLVDYHGNMVGLVTSHVGAIDAEQKRYYAIAVNDVYRSFEEYLQSQQGDMASSNAGDRILLGVNYRMISDFDVVTDGLTVDSGAIIEGPQQKTYAALAAFNATLGARSGLLDGDIVIMVNNDVVDIENNLARLMHKYKQGDAVVLKVVRGKDVVTIPVNVSLIK